MIKKAKEIVKTALYRIGIEVRKTDSFDLTQSISAHPVQASYMSSGKPFFIEVPLDRIVTFNHIFFPLNIGGGHPFVKTLQKYKENDDLSPRMSTLSKYYELFQPSTANELMDISSPSYDNFNNIGAISALPLWSRMSPEKYCSYIKSVHQKEDVEHGIKSGKFIGCSQYGPVETTKSTMEYNRLISLYELIKRHGLKSLKPVTGIALANESDWVVLISDGNHRLACLSALGYQTTKISLLTKWVPGGIMLRSCARHFPTVVNGYYTEEEALAIFDRALNKKQPRAASGWLTYCNSGL